MTSSDEEVNIPACSQQDVQSLSKDETSHASGLNVLPKRNLKRKRITRLVSQDELESIAEDSVTTGMLPSRSVSEFDDATPETLSIMPNEAHIGDVPPLPNPLDDTSTLKTHIAALRLEAELHPMRLILTRLMCHQTHNRKGIFNVPVDAQALGLTDYHQVIARPMDLGSVKRRLHAVAYESRQKVAEDIRLVFSNAMLYNPPSNPVHKAAKELLAVFEHSFHGLQDAMGDNDQVTLEQMTPSDVDPTKTLHPIVLARTVSTVDDEVGQPLNHQTTCSMGQCDATLASHSQETMYIEDPLTIGSSKQSARLPLFLPHSCGTCKGRTCQMCHQGCLLHEPALMVCHGVHCEGARLRKGSVYYVSADGHRHYCQRCYGSLPPVLPGTSEDDPCRYKQDLLKRTNNEEIVEQWLNCSNCCAGVHHICAMHNGYVHDDCDYLCLECKEKPTVHQATPSQSASRLKSGGYTFISGSDVPVSIESLGIVEGNSLTADSLPSCAVSSFIQAKVGKCMQRVPNSDKTIFVRVVSDSSRHFSVPDVVRRHFRMASKSDEIVTPPSQVHYRQKAITLFQKIDGLDVCIFCMYVQEYDGDDQYDETDAKRHVASSHDKRVYIAYIDSVEHFRPRECRTEVYQEILVSYLATARERGYHTAHIWACPPSRGNSFVFWNHPSSQRTPNRERLINWYHGALSRAISCGVVTDVKSLFESDFKNLILEDEDQDMGLVPKHGRVICPPLLDGDFWIEEAVRVHSVSLARYIKVRASTDVCVWNVTPLKMSELDPCPALQIATLVKDRIMTHPSSAPFRRPVNAAAMKLKNYHKIVTRPMDLGTIHAQCMIGEYHELRQVVDDVELMVANAKRFNPVGHYVHIQADEVLALFYQELSSLIKIWESRVGYTADDAHCESWEAFAKMSMSLDKTLDLQLVPNSNSEPTSVFIEDDRSSDGSRSLNSSVTSMPGSPLSSLQLSKESTNNSDVHSRRMNNSSDKSRRRVSSGQVRARGRGRRGSIKGQEPPKKLDLLSDGPDAIMQSMIGDDLWLIDKRSPPPNGPTSKSGAKRRQSASSVSNDGVVSFDEPSAKRRRQSWVGEEVSEAVRRLRTSFFVCSLMPKSSMSDAEQQKLSEFKDYICEYSVCQTISATMAPSIGDARQALLEFSQFRHFEFDTLRRAKYSTAMLIYHLKNNDAPGVVPICNCCNQVIQDVRWHKVKKTAEKRRITKFMKQVPPEPAFKQEELCATCHTTHHEKDEFIPIPVSMKLGQD